MNTFEFMFISFFLKMIALNAKCKAKCKAEGKKCSAGVAVAEGKKCSADMAKTDEKKCCAKKV